MGLKKQNNTNNENTASGQANESFFAQFPLDLIFKLWHESKSISEIAQKLGLKDPNDLQRVDYQYIKSLKTRENWQKNVVSVNRQAERERAAYVKQLSSQELNFAMNLNGIQTLSHLALHFLLSPKHGRSLVRARILELDLIVKSSLHKGVHGVSKTPQHWPTKYYEKRVGQKKMVCSACGFIAKVPQQIELHHPTDMESGPKNKRNPEYYQTPNLTELCANCHSLEHRTGEHLLRMCGKWHIKLPIARKYSNPDDIFSSNCKENYRLQKSYFLKWHLKSEADYQCQCCGVTRWGKDQKLLSLELHHKDGSHKNSLISNLEL